MPGNNYEFSQIRHHLGKLRFKSHYCWVSLPKPSRVLKDKMERTGVCFGCHQLMGDEEFWSKVAEPGYLTDQQHLELMKKAIEAFADRLPKP